MLSPIAFCHNRYGRSRYIQGSGNVGMLVDGVPYGLLEEYSGDVLIQLPALFFNQISLGAFPPINAVPDGDVGILNLVPRMYGTGDSLYMLRLGRDGMSDITQERY